MIHCYFISSTFNLESWERRRVPRRRGVLQHPRASAPWRPPPEFTPSSGSGGRQSPAPSPPAPPLSRARDRTPRIHARPFGADRPRLRTPPARPIAVALARSEGSTTLGSRNPGTSAGIRAEGEGNAASRAFAPVPVGWRAVPLLDARPECRRPLRGAAGRPSAAPASIERDETKSRADLAPPARPPIHVARRVLPPPSHATIRTFDDLISGSRLRPSVVPALRAEGYRRSGGCPLVEVGIPRRNEIKLIDCFVFLKFETRAKARALGMHGGVESKPGSNFFADGGLEIWWVV